MSNPYEAPLSGDAAATRGVLPPPQEPGLVGQVRVVSILMIVQGALDLLAGLGLILIAGFMGFMLQMEDFQVPQGEGPPPQVVFNMMTWLYGGLGAWVAAIGALNIYAGLRSFRFRNRLLGIIAMLSGLGTAISCYCLPTSLALCIYGLIVYLNGPVVNAFQMGEQGYTGDEILVTYSRVRYDQSSFESAG